VLTSNCTTTKLVIRKQRINFDNQETQRCNYFQTTRSFVVS